MQRLVDLKELTEANSYAEVMKNALRLYEELINKHKESNALLLKDKQGNVIEYRVF